MNKDNINTSIVEHVSLARFRRRFKQSIEDWVRSWVINLLQNNISASIDNTGGSAGVTPQYDPNTGILTFYFTGLKGEKGNDGTAVRRLGTFSSSSDLNNVTNPNLGDGYLIDGYLWVYLESQESGSVNGFKNVGLIQGPAGVGLDFNWSGTSLGIKRSNESTYPSYVDLKGADGTKWHTINSSTQLIGTVANTDYSTTLVASCKAGDYCLNAYNDNVYECQSVSTSGSTTTSIWHYKGNIKGGKGDQGTGLQFRWTGGGTYLEVKRTTDSSWQSSGYLKGLDGQPGRDGTIVSKAYRFMPSQGHLHAAGAALNGWEAYLDSRQIIADARITINERDMMANVHLTIMSCLDFQNHANFTSWYDWMEHFIDAYGMGDNWVGYVYGWLLPPNGNVNTDRVEFENKIPKNFWYGTMTIRHETSGPGKAPKAGMSPVELDLHGVLDLKTLKSEEIFDELFADGMSFSFALSSDLV